LPALTIVSQKLPAASAISFGCAEPLREPGGASNSHSEIRTVGV
jgi:hypothetical protein